MSLESNSPGSLPAFILTAHEMMQADQHAIGTMCIPQRVLMEHAAMACVRDLINSCPRFPEKKIIVICGKGNNGGDGVVIARILAGLGASVRLVSLFEIPESGEELRGVWDSFLSVSSDYLVCKDIKSLSAGLDLVAPGDVIIDAITGTGYSGRPRGFLKSVVDEVNRVVAKKTCSVFSVDIPGGNSPDEEDNNYEGIKANRTWALQCLKPIHVNPEADQVCGIATLLDIAIPKHSISETFPRKIISRTQVREILSRVYPDSANSWKGEKGHVLVVGGSKGMEGAPVLSCISALRAGAGLVTLVRPSEKKDIPVPPEVMQKQLPVVSGDGSFGSFDRGFWDSVLDKKKAVVIGPGMGTGTDSSQVLEYIIQYSGENNIPLVIDADAITLLSENRELASRLGANCILTPHYGEFSRLIGETPELVKARRLNLSYEFTRHCSSVLLLKGPNSVVSCKDVQYVSPYQVSTLGVAGSGDILSGILGAFLARGLTPLETTLASIVLHAESARSWELENAISSGMLASEVTKYIPHVLSKILEDASLE